MTWDLEEMGDDAVSLRRDDGLVLSATRVAAEASESAPASGAREWRFAIEDERTGDRLADHGWEIVDEEHLWAVLDGFTHRFQREEDGGATEQAAESGEAVSGSEAAETEGNDEPSPAAEAALATDETTQSDARGGAQARGTDQARGAETTTTSKPDRADEAETATEPGTGTESTASPETESSDDDSSTKQDEATETTSTAEADRVSDHAVADGPDPAETKTTAAAAKCVSPEHPSSKEHPAESDREMPAASSTAEKNTTTRADESTTQSSTPTHRAEATDGPEQREPAGEADRDEATSTPERDDVAAGAEPSERPDRDDEPATAEQTGTSTRGADVQIREARPDDADRLAAVYRSAYAENRELGFPAAAESATPAMVGAWIDEKGVIVASVGGAVVGALRLEATAPDRVKVSRLGVHADWKGRGVGSRLLDAAEAAVNAGNAETVWLTTPEDHPYLPAFYRERGYERTDEYPLDNRDYDEIVMEKSVG